MDFGGIASSGLDLLSGILNSAGAVYQNRMSRKSARHAQKRQFEFVAQQAQVARDFAERMANTAHQREVSDLRAAGLNPILSAGGSGASSPALAAASSSAVTPDVVNPASGLASGLSSSAKSLQKFLSQEYQNHLDQQSADKRLTNQQSLESAQRSRLDGVNFDIAQQQLARMQSTQEKEVATANLEAENDFTRAMLEKAAMKYEYGIEPLVNRYGQYTVKYHSAQAFDRALNLAREGLRSDLKVRANQNWRNNLGSFMPFGSAAQGAVNSANGLRWFFRK